MSAGANDAPPTFRWWYVIRGVEPPPAAFLTRRPFHPWLIVIVSCISGFMGQLDASIVQLTLPALKSALDTSVTDVRWVAIAYLLTYAACLPVFGRVSEMRGRKILFLMGFALFTLATLLCGLAPDLASLVAFRVLQGIGGAMLGANSIAILVKSIDAARRARAVGLYTAAQAIGVSAGPMVGGLLLYALDWRWVFWAGVPFGLSALVLGWLVLPRSVDIAVDKKFDWPGALLLMPSLVLAILALNQVSVWPLASPAMILCILASAAFMALFARREQVTTYPLVNLGLFGRRAFACGIVGVGLGYALLYGMFFLMSFALMHGFHDSAQVAGFKLAIIPVTLGLIAPLSGRWGSHTVGVAGMALCAAALLVLSMIALKPIGSLVSGLTAFAMFGVGLGLFITPNSNATIDAAPASASGEAAAVINLFRVFGSCVGVSSASSMMSWRMEAMAGSAGQDVLLAGHPLIEAVESSLALLVVFAVIAGAASLVRPRGPA
jgi:EmrB/QacA subfamily drug resistance transporter